MSASALTGTVPGHPLGARQPEPGQTIELAAGIHWVRMALPFTLDHINLWLLRDRDPSGQAGWAIVDCGVSDALTRAHWQTVFARTLGGDPLLRVLVTHMHPDHVGLAHWLTRHPAGGPGCPLYMNTVEHRAARTASRIPLGLSGPEAAAFFAQHGLCEPEALQSIGTGGNDYARLVPEVPESCIPLRDGLRLELAGQEWLCIAGYGHSPEHIALHCPALNLLISGDMVLPGISTNISVLAPDPEADPLPRFLASLERLRALPEQTLVLPSHGRPFTGLHARITQLQAHHRRRLAQTLALCRERPTSAQELVPTLFRRVLNLHQTPLALGEAIAHLHMLWHAGQLRREESPDGVYRFSATHH